MKKIRVVAAGYFDPIHRGHINYLKEAKRLGDELIVIVNPDENVIKKKGYCVMPLKDRIAILSELRSVDVIVLPYDKDGTIRETLRILKPDIFAIAGVYKLEEINKEEQLICREINCNVIYGVGGLREQSSSEIASKLKEYFYDSFKSTS